MAFPSDKSSQDGGNLEQGIKVIVSYIYSLRYQIKKYFFTTARLQYNIYIIIELVCVL